MGVFKPPLYETLPVRVTVLHENNSQGVLYEFAQGSRKWQSRQRRGLCVGGELDGQRLTAYEISQSKFPNWYFQFNNAGKSQERFIWAFTKE